MPVKFKFIVLENTHPFWHLASIRVVVMILQDQNCSNHRETNNDHRSCKIFGCIKKKCRRQSEWIRKKYCVVKKQRENQMITSRFCIQEERPGRSLRTTNMSSSLEHYCSLMCLKKCFHSADSNRLTQIPKPKRNLNTGQLLEFGYTVI